ncbi:MAG: hypothetical protein ACKO0M_02220 [Cyanobium sp.]
MPANPVRDVADVVFDAPLGLDPVALPWLGAFPGSGYRVGIGQVLLTFPLPFLLLQLEDDFC